MCDLKSFSFLHHFGSGFKYFSAAIIRKLSKILNLWLSGESGKGRKQAVPYRTVYRTGREARYLSVSAE